MRKNKGNTPIRLVLALVAISACGDETAPTAELAPDAGASASGLVATAPISATATTPPTTDTATEPPPVVSGSASVAAGSGSASAGPVKTATPVKTAPTSTTTAPPPTASATTTAPPPEPVLTTPAAGSADAVAAEVDEIYKDTTRFKASFKQKHKQKVSGVEREQAGVVWVERPNKISFRYDAPSKNRIVSDGAILKLYVAEDQQMFEHPVKDTEYPGAFGFIMGGGLRKSFEFTFNEKIKFELGHVLVGKPRAANPQYEQVLFYIDKTKLGKKDPGAVTGVLILDAQGNRNRFELFNASFPDKIEASEFTFTPPAGTTITK